MADEPKNTSSRRDFLAAAGASLVALTACNDLPQESASPKKAPLASRNRPGVFDLYTEMQAQEHIISAADAKGIVASDSDLQRALTLSPAAKANYNNDILPILGRLEQSGDGANWKQSDAAQAKNKKDLMFALESVNKLSEPDKTEVLGRLVYRGLARIDEPEFLADVIAIIPEAKKMQFYVCAARDAEPYSFKDALEKGITGPGTHSGTPEWEPESRAQLERLAQSVVDSRSQQR